MITHRPNFAGNEQALRGYLTNLRTRVRDDDAQRMLDYILSYNSLSANNNMTASQIVNNIRASDTEEERGGIGGVYDDAHTDVAVNSAVRRSTGNQNHAPQADNLDSPSAIETLLHTAQLPRCETNDEDASANGVDHGLLSTHKRFTSPTLLTIHKTMNSPSAGRTKESELQPSALNKPRSVD